ncbi:hypothetical protein OEW28_16265 [Defluviimonas sp. WL0002]|uniref:Uncharacterized protein n=1 Tax=Albidovulum marisflavi TaxID=2984159 RepID=A0ABT2ZGE7_9RHOB|nr:hypothetical protein [Defluviimonas sp. WL0002]MCV2870186.1 hypothetical protein [Defluviimonas sp. WL0002]
MPMPDVAAGPGTVFAAIARVAGCIAILAPRDKFTIARMVAIDVAQFVPVRGLWSCSWSRIGVYLALAGQI